MADTPLKSTFSHSNLPITNKIIIGPLRDDPQGSKEMLNSFTSALTEHIDALPELECVGLRNRWYIGEGWTLVFTMRTPFKASDYLPAIEALVEQCAKKAGFTNEEIENIAVVGQVSPTIELQVEELKEHIVRVAEQRRNGEKPEPSNF